jgi:uncharacterized membrane protein
MLELLEALHQIIADPLSWSTVIAIILFYLRVREAKFKQARNERVERKLDALLRKEGIEWKDGPPSESSKAQMILNRLLLLPSAVIFPGAFLYIKRRRKKMAQTVNFVVLFSAILGALKLILQPFGIDLSGITDETVNAMANGFAALLVIIGIIRDNFSKFRKTPDAQQQPKFPFDSTKSS